MEFTPNLNLPKPADGEDGWGDEMRTAMDTLDDLSPRLSTLYPGSAVAMSAANVDALPSSSGSYQVPTINTPVNLHDPQGFLQTTSHVGTWHAFTFGARTWLTLPQGVWLCLLGVGWASYAGTGSRYGALQLIDDYTTTDPVQDMIAEVPTSATPAAVGSIGFSPQRNLTVVPVPPDETRNVGTILYQNSGSPQTISFIDIAVVQIGV